MNPSFLLAGLVGAIGLFGLGVKVGSEFQAGRCDGELLAQLQMSSSVLDRKENEIAQCKAQVTKINQTVADQSDKLARMLRADRRQVAAAQQEQRERDIARDRSQEAVRLALENLKGELNAGNFNTCAGERADPDLLGLLNTALREIDNGVGRDSDLPAPGGAD